MARVTAGILATYRSLDKTGGSRLFDFFILSDSGDPDAWIEEECAWRRLCRELEDSGNLFYYADGASIRNAKAVISPISAAVSDADIPI